MRSRGIVVLAAEAARERTEFLADAAAATGQPVSVITSGWRTVPRAGVVITVSAHPLALARAALLQRTGASWLADLSAEAVGAAPAAFERRTIRSADAVSCPSEADGRHLYATLGLSPAHITDSARLERALASLEAARHVDGRRRVLMIGPVNSPHLESLAGALHQRGYVVQTGGAAWGGGLPASSLPDAGIPVSAITNPQILWLRRLIRRFRPDLIHAHWMPFAAMAALARASPLVAMAWGSDVHLASASQRRLYRLAVRRAALVLADSRDVLDRLIELGAPADHSSVIGWGVDLDTFAPPATSEVRAALRRELGLGPGPVVVAPRGIKPIYNPRATLDAFARVRATHPDAQLVLKHNDEPAALADLSLPPGTYPVGRIPYARVADYLRAADVCVSVPASDSSPRTVWESMACGCPCVLSDLPWVRELIEPERDALVVTPEPAAIAAAIERLLDDTAVHERVISAGLALVRRHHDARAQIDRLEALYARVRAPRTYHPGDAR